MRRCIAMILAYSVAIAPMAVAQDTIGRVQALQEVPEVPAIPEGVDRIETLTEGQEAPFTGMLLDTDTAIRWTNALRWWPETFRLRTSLLVRIYTETQGSHQLRLRLVEESYGREIEGLRVDVRSLAQQLADAQSRKWYETVEFGVVVGVLLVVLIGGVGGGLALGITN